MKKTNYEKLTLLISKKVTYEAFQFCATCFKQNLAYFDNANFATYCLLFILNVFRNWTLSISNPFGVGGVEGDKNTKRRKSQLKRQNIDKQNIE